jgi:hypothetical protein
VFRSRLDRDPAIFDKYMLNKSVSCLHIVAWCPRSMDALNATRCLLFDDYERLKSRDCELVPFENQKSHFCRIDRTIVSAFNTQRKCLIRRLLSRQDEEGRTALQVASTIGNTDLVIYLLFKAREVWYWPNIQRYVMIEHIVPKWREKQQQEDAKNKSRKSGKNAHIEMKIDEDDQETDAERFALELSSSTLLRNRFKKDVEDICEMFSENSEKTEFRPRCLSDKSGSKSLKLARDVMIKAYVTHTHTTPPPLNTHTHTCKTNSYSKYRSRRHKHFRLKQLGVVLEDLSKKEKTQLDVILNKKLDDDSKSYKKLRNYLRDCSGDGGLEAFVRPKDMFLNACQFCGISPYAFSLFFSSNISYLIHIFFCFIYQAQLRSHSIGTDV